jgi:elongation factor Ts
MSDSPVITSEMVDELRAFTDAPRMECKRALVHCDGDMEKAKEFIRSPPVVDTLQLVKRIEQLERQVARLSFRT